MTLGYDKPLYLMAFDHRGSFEHGLCFDGFAVGRTLWQQALQDFLAGKADRADAVHRIAARYRDVIDTYRAAEAVAPTSNGDSG